MNLFFELDRGDERHLALLPAPPGGAAYESNAEVGVVELRGSAQHRAGLVLYHRLHQLVLAEPAADSPRRDRASPPRPTDRSVRLADWIHRRKRDGQSQFTAYEQRPGDQRGPMMAAIALKCRVGGAAQQPLRSPAATRPAKPVRPAPPRTVPWCRSIGGGRRNTSHADPGSESWVWSTPRDSQLRCSPPQPGAHSVGMADDSF